MEATRRNCRWLGALMLAVAGLTTTLVGASSPAAARGPDKYHRIDRPRSQAAATLTNGTGDAHAEVTVDAYGEFGSDAASGGDLLYDPVGPIGQASTTFYSTVWFSGAGLAGVGGSGELLGETELSPVDFLTVDGSHAVSEWTLGGLRFHLEQEMLPASATGSTFRQTYTIRNDLEGPTNFDLIRHLDGDLLFDETLDDGGGASANGQTLFEFDSGEDPTSPTTFVGIDLNNNANLGYRIAEYRFDDDVFALGRAVLNNTFTADNSGDNGVNADVNGDRLTDFPFDVTLSLGQTFTVPPGGTVTFITNTILGEGTPTEVIGAPSNLQATAVFGGRIILTWQDNSTDETSFGIERKTEGEISSATNGGTFQPIATVGPNVTTFTDTGLPPNTTFTYRVRAFRGTEGPSGYSNEASATTLGVGSTPPPPGMSSYSVYAQGEVPGLVSETGLLTFEGRVTRSGRTTGRLRYREKNTRSERALIRSTSVEAIVVEPLGDRQRAFVFGTAILQVDGIRSDRPFVLDIRDLQERILAPRGGPRDEVSLTLGDDRLVNSPLLTGHARVPRF
ncbi:MAG: fibronectin type III domain-containing protein [Armatimonadetes bacterium]|nr:fibronectin type III domain-containing protein [Armatimonadota bacterium]